MKISYQKIFFFKVYFVIFGHLHEFLLIFKVRNPFRYLKQLEKERNQPNNAWAQSGPRACTVGSARDRKWPMGSMTSAWRVGGPVGRLARDGGGGTTHGGALVDEGL
jgi:hypothetical protein